MEEIIYLIVHTSVNLIPQVFVPTYEGSVMEMVKLQSMDDYESLPLTKWNIKQPVLEGRENALQTGRWRS